MAHSLRLVVIQSSYSVAKDFYTARYCVNVDQPELMCNAKCFINDLTEANIDCSDHESRVETLKFAELPYAFSSLIQLDRDIHLTSNIFPAFQRFFRTRNYRNGVFRPPVV